MAPWASTQPAPVDPPTISPPSSPYPPFSAFLTLSSAPLLPSFLLPPQIPKRKTLHISQRPANDGHLTHCPCNGEHTQPNVDIHTSCEQLDYECPKDAYPWGWGVRPTLHVREYAPHDMSHWLCVVGILCSVASRDSYRCYWITPFIAWNYEHS